MTRPPAVGTLVEPLDEADRGVGEQGREQPGDEGGVEVAEVGVEEHEDVAGGHVQRLPQGLALARARPLPGQDVGRRHHERPAAAATAAVPSVDPSSTTTTSSTTPRRSTSSRTIAATIGPDGRLLVARRQAHGNAPGDRCGGHDGMLPPPL